MKEQRLALFAGLLTFLLVLGGLYFWSTEGSEDAIPVPGKADEEFRFSRSAYQSSQKDVEAGGTINAIPRTEKNHTIRCIELYPVPAKSLPERIGIRQGDCIVSIRDVSFSLPSQIADLYQALTEPGAFEYVIERQGAFRRHRVVVE